MQTAKALPKAWAFRVSLATSLVPTGEAVPCKCKAFEGGNLMNLHLQCSCIDLVSNIGRNDQASRPGRHYLWAEKTA